MNFRQRGITVIETVGALAIGTLMLIGLTKMIDNSMEDLEGQQAAFYQLQVVDAARKYISTNSATLNASTAAAAVSVNLQTLKDGDFLPAGFASTNAFNQTSCIIVRQPAAGKLEALVLTSGGKKIEDRNIALVAANAGKGSGYISTADFTNAKGASWSVPTADYLGIKCPGSADDVLLGDATDGGHLASLIFFDGAAEADFLHRSEVVGRPDLNTLNTPLLLAGKATEVTVGDACTTAAVGTDGSGRLATCTVDAGGTRRWMLVNSGSPWKGPVDSYDELPVDDVGDVRMVMGTVNRAFVYTTAGWQPLGIDQNGDLNVPNNMTAEQNVKARADLIAHNRLYARSADIEEWIEADHIYLENFNNTVDSPCNYPSGNYDKTGKPIIYFPQGSIVPDKTTGMLLVCPNDTPWGVPTRFKYQNNAYGL